MKSTPPTLRLQPQNNNQVSVFNNNFNPSSESDFDNNFTNHESSRLQLFDFNNNFELSSDFGYLSSVSSTCTQSAFSDFDNNYINFYSPSPLFDNNSLGTLSL
ncbi:hypothetical protein Sjap_009284 [Stephania japonica]|uniref:Uncharacterized protein n=1 Tax=Stephania japonica TaxID=461633 RepID=A0AAP0JTE3_9MAGN